MVTTRRQSKTLEPPPLPPVAPPKRKRSNDATSAPSATQLTNQPSTKRRKKVKSTAKLDNTSVPAETAPAAPLAKKKRNPPSAKATKRKPRRQTAQREETVHPKTNGTNVASSQKSAHVDLATEDESSEDEAPRQPQPIPSQDADDELADSRYALGSKRKGNSRKPTAPTTRRTAELKFEEDGLEEVDKAQVAVTDASNRRFTQEVNFRPTLFTPIKKSNAVELHSQGTPQVNGKGKNKAKHSKTPPAGVPSRVVMFTIVEAIAALALYKDGTMSMAAEIDPESRQPYEPLQTGEHLSYPVKGSYHLGALGRYGIDTTPPVPFSLTVPLSEHSFIESAHSAPPAEPPRHGLGFSALPARPEAPSVRRPNNYCFTFGRYRGRRMDSVPISYLRSIFAGDEYHNDAKLQQAFADLYPKGLYESEAESFTFEKGGFKGKRLDEVPKSYLWGLVRKKNEGGDIDGKKGRGKLERALEVWEQGQLDLTKD